MVLASCTSREYTLKWRLAVVRGECGSDTNSVWRNRGFGKLISQHLQRFARVTFCSGAAWRVSQSRTCLRLAMAMCVQRL